MLATDAARLYKGRAIDFVREAHMLLGRHETSHSRVNTASQTRKRLATLSLLQDELFSQAIDAIEHNLQRAAIVLAWAGFVDFLEQKLDSDGLAKVKGANPAWARYRTIEDLRENVTEYALVEAARKVGLVTKTQMKAIHGLLAKRNECAHPSSHTPDFNEALGYISDVLSRIEKLEPKTL